MLTRSLAALVFIGCALPACLGTQRYEPLRVEVRAPSVIRAQAIHEYALDEDLYVARRTPEWSNVVLLSRPRRSRQGTTRERIQIDGTQETVEVSVWTEIRDRGSWTRSDTVCDSYAHAREQEIARRLRTIIRRSLLL